MSFLKHYSILSGPDLLRANYFPFKVSWWSEEALGTPPHSFHKQWRLQSHHNQRVQNEFMRHVPSKNTRLCRWSLLIVIINQVFALKGWTKRRRCPATPRQYKARVIGLFWPFFWQDLQVRVVERWGFKPRFTSCSGRKGPVDGRASRSSWRRCLMTKSTSPGSFSTRSMGKLLTPKLTMPKPLWSPPSCYQKVTLGASLWNFCFIEEPVWTARTGTGAPRSVTHARTAIWTPWRYWSETMLTRRL